MTSIHGGLPITRVHGREGYRRATHSPQKQTAFHNLRPSFFPQSLSIHPTSPDCQTKRQSVLWKAHTSFYVINNPLVNNPTRGSFCVTPTRTQKHILSTQRNPAGKPSRQPIRVRGADTPPPHTTNRHAAASCTHTPPNKEQKNRAIPPRNTQTKKGGVRGENPRWSHTPEDHTNSYTNTYRRTRHIPKYTARTT